MDKLGQFWEAIAKEMALTLATSAEGRVTMRLVSPVPFEGAILMFTSPDSKKYRQLKDNPRCCIAVGAFFAECEAELRGGTMLDDNKALRDAYSLKFHDAFDENVEFGGRSSEFILLRPTLLSGWAFPDDAPTEDGIPTMPFELPLA